MADYCFIMNPHSLDIFWCVCCVIFQVKTTWLQLGISVKAMILVSHLHMKDTIAKTYPN